MAAQDHLIRTGRSSTVAGRPCLPGRHRDVVRLHQAAVGGDRIPGFENHHVPRTNSRAGSSWSTASRSTRQVCGTIACSDSAVR